VPGGSHELAGSTSSPAFEAPKPETTAAPIPASGKRQGRKSSLAAKQRSEEVDVYEKATGYKYTQLEEERIFYEGDVALPCDGEGVLRLTGKRLKQHVEEVHGSRRSGTMEEENRIKAYIGLMGKAALYTTKADVRCWNRRASVESGFSTRPHVPTRVQELMANFSFERLGAAVVVIDDCEDSKLVFEAWRAHDYAPLIRLVERYEAPGDSMEEVDRTAGFTLVGNHSTDAHVRLIEQNKVGVCTRRAFVFFESQLAKDDFRFISRHENVLVQADAVTTHYQGHCEPLNVIPFIRQVWKSPEFGMVPRAPAGTTSNSRNEQYQRYWRFHNRLQQILERPEQISRSEEKEDKDKEDKGVVRFYQADLNFAMFKDEVYEAFIGALQRLKNGTMVGLKRGLGLAERAVYRHHYKAVSAYPEDFYKSTFVHIDSRPSVQKLIAKVNNPRSQRPVWEAASTGIWFKQLQRYAAWDACFHAYKRFRQRLLAEASENNKDKEWEEMLRNLVPWNPEENDSLKAFENESFRIFVYGLQASKKERLGAKALKNQVDRNESDAKAAYEKLIEEDLKNDSWLQQFVTADYALDRKKSPEGGQANNQFKKIVGSHSNLLKDVQGAPAEFFTGNRSRMHTRLSKVCRRPKPEENLILLGAGDGLEKLTSEEFKYLQPFFLVVRGWLKQQPYLLFSHKQVVDYIGSEVIQHLRDLGRFICQVGLPQLQLRLFQFSMPHSEYSNWANLDSFQRANTTT
jgi:hypothetical protein